MKTGKALCHQIQNVASILVLFCFVLVPHSASQLREMQNKITLVAVMGCRRWMKTDISQSCSLYFVTEHEQRKEHIFRRRRRRRWRRAPNINFIFPRGCSTLRLHNFPFAFMCVCVAARSSHRGSDWTRTNTPTAPIIAPPSYSMNLMEFK